jgi:hypothetical protein
MVRYPHSANISTPAGSVINGEWVAETPTTESIQGRFEPSNSNNIIRKNALGNEVVVKGQFFTKAQAIAGATSLKIDSIQLDAKIICWEPFQTHSVINV